MALPALRTADQHRTRPNLTHPSRRRVLKSGLSAAGLGLGAIGLLGECSATVSTADASSSTTGGPWTFTDDRGTTVRLDSAPTKVVAYTGTAAALYDFGVTDRIVGVFGPAEQANGASDPMAGNLPVNRLTILGNANSEPRHSYPAIGPIVQGFATALQNAKKVA